MVSEPVLLVEDVGAVRLLTLNRPDARNALSGELITALYRALVTADADPTVNVVVLTGADPAFCAGVDLKEAARDGTAYFARFDTEDCISQVARTRIPIIGAVNGAAFTGGLELALGCDFLIASERAVFADTHVRVGVLPGGGMTARLPRVVGGAMARRLSMTGEVIDAVRAERIGLVTEVVEHGRLLPRTLEIAAAIAEVPRAAMQALKEMYVTGAAPAVDHALAAERAIASRLTPDLADLDARRQAVTARNRAQIAGPSTATPNVNG